MHIMYLKGERMRPEKDANLESEQCAIDTNDAVPERAHGGVAEVVFIPNVGLGGDDDSEYLRPGIVFPDFPSQLLGPVNDQSAQRTQARGSSLLHLHAASECPCTDLQQITQALFPCSGISAPPEQREKRLLNRDDLCDVAVPFPGGFI